MVKGKVLIINIPSSTHNIRHPPTWQLVANQIFVAIFKPLGGIVLLTLVKVAMRVTDGPQKLDVLLAT